MRIPVPNFTQSPNELFDEWLPLLGHAELKVLMVIIRKTFGWHKIRDRISLGQLEKLTGLERRHIIKATKSLQSRHLITKNVVGEKGQQETFYELVIDDSNNSYQCPSDTPTSVLRTPTKETSTKEIEAIPPYPQNGGNPPISPEGGNETAPKPKRKRRESEPKKEKAERVWITDAQEESIKKKVDGDEIMVKLCYERLSQWKIDNSVTDGSDYLKILKWVIKAVYKDLEKAKIQENSSNVPYASSLEGVHRENWEKNFKLIEKLQQQFPHKARGLYFFYKNYLLKDKNRGKDGEIFDVSALINHRSFCGVVGKHLDIEITIDPEEKY